MKIIEFAFANHFLSIVIKTFVNRYIQQNSIKILFTIFVSSLTMKICCPSNLLSANQVYKQSARGFNKFLPAGEIEERGEY